MNSLQQIYELIPRDKQAEFINHLLRVNSFVAERATLLLSVTNAKISLAEWKACELFGIEYTIFKSSSRKQGAVYARSFMYYFLRRSLGWTFEDIGKYYGKKSHASIINGIRTFDDLSATDKQFRAKFDTFANSIINNKNNEQSSTNVSESAGSTCVTPTDVLLHRTVNN